MGWRNCNCPAAEGSLQDGEGQFTRTRADGSSWQRGGLDWVPGRNVLPRGVRHCKGSSEQPGRGGWGWEQAGPGEGVPAPSSVQQQPQPGQLCHCSPGDTNPQSPEQSPVPSLGAEGRQAGLCPCLQGCSLGGAAHTEPLLTMGSLGGHRHGFYILHVLTHRLCVLSKCNYQEEAL